MLTRSCAAQEFQIADAHLRETLPPIITTTFSLIPPLLHAMIQIQNRILAVYYTVMHQYCEDNNFPSPPPPMEDVISRWASLFRPAQRDVESIPCIARGRAVNTSMQLGEDALALRKTSTAAPPTYAPPRHRPDVVGTNGSAVRRVPSANALAAVSEPAPPPPNMQTRPDIRVSSSGLLVPTSFTQATVYNGQPVSPGTANGGGGHYSPSSPIHRVPSGDHFGGSATGSSSRPVTAQSTMSSSSTSLALQGKKKPPPPPPPKRLASAPRPPDEFVVAQYPFSGQGAGDLSFRAGDRIKIIKRTATDQDWWEGELESCPGVRGQFPANYCKVV